MAIVFGRNSYIITGAETTWGTASGAFNTNASRLISTTLQRTQERDRQSHLSTSDGAMSMGTFDTFELCEGNITVPVYYSGSGMFLQALCGRKVVTSGSGPYTHYYRSDNTDMCAGANMVAFSAKVQRGSAVNGHERFLGLVVSSGTISVEAGGEMTMSLEFIGKTADARTTSLTSPTFSTAKQVYHYEAGTLSFNGVNYSVRSFEFTVDNKLERRNVLGSKLTESPDVTDFRECSISVELDVDSTTENNFYTAALAGTESAVSITFTQSGASNTINFTLNNSIISDYSDPISTVGRLTRNVTFQCLAAPTNFGFKITVVNADSSGIIG